MKKLIGVLLAVFFLIALPMSTAQSTNQPEIVTQQQDIVIDERSGEGKNESDMNSPQQMPFDDDIMPQRISEMREQMREQREELIGNASRQGSMIQNQNEVRMAVHSLLMMKDYVGKFGQDVSEVAREMNQSVERIENAQERIRNRSSVARFFIGGNDEAAEELANVANQTQERVQKLKQIRDECDCPDEIKVMLEEQIQQIEKEQKNIQEMAQKEQQRSGLFGWLF